MMLHCLRKTWDEKPLVIILALAIFFRLLAVIFSKGFGMQDDHYLVIEASQAWVEGTDYNHWLPRYGAKTPSGHSLFYPGAHYFFFKTLEAINITEPQTKMHFVRLVHALLSLISIVFGYRITKHFSDIKTARAAGLMLAILWFYPMASVRNLVEMVCIPFLMVSVWNIIKGNEQKNLSWIFLSGLLAGIAFSIRYQTFLFAVGLGIALLIQKKWKSAFLFGFAYFLCIGLVQGLTDYIIWGRPFAEFQEYFRYNIVSATAYFDAPWYQYFIVLTGVLIPPISFFLLFGFFLKWKQNTLLFLPSFIFLVFHSYFPNKQERFILPVLPFIILLGLIGWNEFVSKSSFWKNKQKLLYSFWFFFWTVNTLPLYLLSVSYSKKSNVESMIYLSHKTDFQGLIIEDSNSDREHLLPKFYLKNFTALNIVVRQSYSVKQLHEFLNNTPEKSRPNYVIFMRPDNLERRVREFKNYFPDIQYETTIEPGLLDKLLYQLNPANRNYTFYIYKIEGAHA